MWWCVTDLFYTPVPDKCDVMCGDVLLTWSAHQYQTDITRIPKVPGQGMSPLMGSRSKWKKSFRGRPHLLWLWIDTLATAWGYFSITASQPPTDTKPEKNVTPDRKVPGANMGPIWGRQEPGGPQVGPRNFAIWDGVEEEWGRHVSKWVQFAFDISRSFFFKDPTKDTP